MHLYMHFELVQTLYQIININAWSVFGFLKLVWIIFITKSE